MPRLIDELRAGGPLAMPFFILPERERSWQELAVRLHSLISQPDLPVVVIDNVAEYYFVASDQERWDIAHDFPNLAPPYPMFWAEHKLPKRIHSKECGDSDVTQWIQEGRAGALIMAIDPADANGEDIPPDTKWILWCELYIDYGQRDVIATGPHGSMFVCIDSEGGLIERPWMQSWADPREAYLMKSLITWLHPFFLAISFLHCKNVRIDSNLVPKPLAKKWHAKTGQWPARYQTLIIEPLKQILRSEGKSDQHGLAKAMHICRGHFRDYREGRGLFGKYHQLVWQPAIVRGTRGKQAPPPQVEVKI